MKRLRNLCTRSNYLTHKSGSFRKFKFASAQGIFKTNKMLDNFN